MLKIKNNVLYAEGGDGTPDVLIGGLNHLKGIKRWIVLRTIVGLNTTYADESFEIAVEGGYDIDLARFQESEAKVIASDTRNLFHTEFSDIMEYQEGEGE